MTQNTLDIIYFIIQIVLIVASFFLGKCLPANKLQKAQSIVYIVTEWADKFVRAARQFLETKTGEEKMEYVISELKKVAEANKWNVTEEQLRAIAQAAYDRMKKEDTVK